MQTKRKNFSGQHFYVGIDVHKKRWVITIRWNGMELKTFSMDPLAEQLAEYLQKHYPDGIYHTVYEAGFCGFHIHKTLVKLGVHSILVNAADVPRHHKETLHKSDPVDSRKLARELEHSSLKGIYVPDDFHLQLRSLCRIRERLVSDQTRWKNRIKSFLAFYGMAMPEHAEMPHWSNRFLNWLESLELDYAPGAESLQVYLRRLRSVREELAWVLRRLRYHVRTHPVIAPVMRRIETASGIGFTTAIHLYTEIIDMKRFPREDHLMSFIGLVPSIQATGDWTSEAVITSRCQRILRFMLIEAAWVAVRKDPALTERFADLTKRMSKNEAIVRIAKALLRRIRYIWLEEESYVTGLVA